MLLRLASTIVLVPPAGAAIWFGSPYFEGMVMIVALIAIIEWCRVSLGSGAGARGAARIGWPVFGVLYIAISCWCLVWLRANPDHGRGLAILLFAVVWSTDIGAYLVGRTLGGPKLAPRISPNKTWSGAIGGLICAAIAAYVAALWGGLAYAGATVLAIGAVLSVFSQIGDLGESWWKRRFAVKDSGNLIPGHGGILDRIDGVLLASPVAAAAYWAGQMAGLPWK
jgi:phosphatidate cytidylyltransferase